MSTRHVDTVATFTSGRKLGLNTIQEQIKIYILMRFLWVPESFCSCNRHIEKNVEELKKVKAGKKDGRILSPLARLLLSLSLYSCSPQLFLYPYAEHRTWWPQGYEYKQGSFHLLKNTPASQTIVCTTSCIQWKERSDVTIGCIKTACTLLLNICCLYVSFWHCDKIVKLQSTTLRSNVISL